MTVMTTKTRATLAENIRREVERFDSEFSINGLADNAGVSRSQLYDVLGCKKGASVDWVEKVAAALRVEAFELLRKRTKPIPRRRDN